MPDNSSEHSVKKGFRIERREREKRRKGEGVKVGEYINRNKELRIRIF